MNDLIDGGAIGGGWGVQGKDQLEVEGGLLGEDRDHLSSQLIVGGADRDND
jgi:hypothetical protein